MVPKKKIRLLLLLLLFGAATTTTNKRQQQQSGQMDADNDFFSGSKIEQNKITDNPF